MQAAAVAFAIVILIVGIILTISPLPFGAVIVVGALSMLLAVSPRTRARLRRLRRKHPKLDRMLGEAEIRSPHVIAAPLEETDGPQARRIHVMARARRTARRLMRMHAPAPMVRIVPGAADGGPDGGAERAAIARPAPPPSPGA